MPVIRWVPLDPTDLVLQGEEMRLAAVSQDQLSMQIGPLRAAYIDQRAAALPPLILDQAEPSDFVIGDENYSPMHPDYTAYDCRLRNVFDATMIAANGMIATPCGALFPKGFGVSGLLIGTFVQATDRFQLAGVTRDSTGATLGNCRVVAMETGRLAVSGAPVVGETISDGSGNYTIPTPNNSAHEVIAYLAGSPDRAGISLNTLTPTVV